MKSRFLKSLFVLGAMISSQAVAETFWIAQEDSYGTLSGYDSIVVQQNSTVEKIENTENGTFLNVQAELTVNSDLEVKQISLSQYDKTCKLTVNGNLTLIKNAKGEGGTLSIAQGETLIVTGTTTINGGSLTSPCTVQTGKLVINGQTSTSGTIVTDEVEVNHTFSLLGGSISATDGGSGVLTIGEGGHAWQQGTTVNMDTVVDNGQMTVYKGSFDSLTMENGKLDIRGNVTTGALTLKEGEVLINSGCVIDLAGENLILSDKVAITINVSNLEEAITGNYTLFTNIGEVSGSPLEVTFQTYEGTETQKAALTYNADGSVTVSAVPEPATATLSLLALAGLCARRRRK